MAGLLNALNAATTSLEVNQKSLEVVGNNIANVNTEGYSRQAPELSPYPSMKSGKFFIGNGVRITSIQRDHDVFIQSQLEDKYIDYGFANGQTRALGELEQIFNVTEENISTEIDRFFDAWQELSTNPSDPVLRDAVIHRGTILSSSFNRLTGDLDTVKQNINETIDSKVGSLNSAIAEIAELNQRIYTVEINEQPANSDRDRRDLLVKNLAESLGTTSYLDQKGMVNLQLPNGLPIVSGNMGMRLETVVSGSDVELQLHAGGTVRNLGTDSLGGEMLGLFNMRDVFVPSIQSDVDRLAWEVSSQVNTQHMAGAGLDGLPAAEFFVDTTATVPPAATIYENAARNIAVLITDANSIAAGLPGTPAPGDNRNALLISGLGEQFSIDGTDNFGSFYGRITSRIGIESNQNALSLGGAEDAVEQLENVREGFVGVSLEEEMISLIRFQRGFESSAKFLSTVDELMESIINLKR